MLRMRLRHIFRAVYARCMGTAACIATRGRTSPAGDTGISSTRGDAAACPACLSRLAERPDGSPAPSGASSNLVQPGDPAGPTGPLRRNGIMNDENHARRSFASAASAALAVVGALSALYLPIFLR